MRLISVQGSDQTSLCVRQFGMEENGTDAKWGPGMRKTVYIFHYVLTGKGYFNGVPLEKNQGFLIRANELLEYHYDPDDPWQYFWVMWEGDLAEEICQKYIRTDQNGIFCYDFIEPLMEMITKLFLSSKSLSHTEALAAFFYLLSLHEEKTEHHSNQYVSDAKYYMYLHIHQPISIVEVAASLGISDRYLYNLFVKHEGISPKKYLNEIRLQNAKALLKSTQHTVTEIAATVGFPDVLAFSRFFSKFTGISPTAYRKTHTSDA